MREIHQITSFELYMHSMLQNHIVEYIRFDKNLKKHVVESGKTLYQYYIEWNDGWKKNTIFTALIKWFDVEKGKLIICLKGTDGVLHYE